MTRKVLFIVSSAAEIGPNKRKTGNYLPEVSHPYAEFTSEGYQVDFASVKGGEPPIDGLDLTDDELNTRFLEGDGLSKMKISSKVEDVDITDYDAVFIPGGLGPMVDMPDNEISHRPFSVNIGHIK